MSPEYPRYSGDTLGILQEYSRHILGILQGYSGDSPGMLHHPHMVRKGLKRHLAISQSSIRSHKVALARLACEILMHCDDAGVHYQGFAFGRHAAYVE